MKWTLIKIVPQIVTEKQSLCQLFMHLPLYLIFHLLFFPHLKSLLFSNLFPLYIFFSFIISFQLRFLSNVFLFFGPLFSLGSITSLTGLACWHVSDTFNFLFSFRVRLVLWSKSTFSPWSFTNFRFGFILFSILYKLHWSLATPFHFCHNNAFFSWVPKKGLYGVRA